MNKRTKNWQEQLLKKYRVPKSDQKEKPILNKKQLKRILETDKKDD